MVNLEKRVVTSGMINTDICKSCGGCCCKTYPCAYFPSDFKKITEDIIGDLIDNQNAVIDYADETSLLGIARFSFLILRARGKLDFNGAFAGVNTRHNNRNVCVNLQPDGCSLDAVDRPGEGLFFIPDKKRCFLPLEYAKKEKEWYQNPVYQDILYNVISEYGDAFMLRNIQDKLVLQKRHR